jgi:glycosyltransferase involved in cell wall biosynthesis
MRSAACPSGLYALVNQRLSVVIPIFNEELNLNILYSKLKGPLRRYENKHEIIFVNDGSTDKSLEVLKGMRENDNQLKIISFVRRFGQTSALAAGFYYATGDILITMDGDLQNDPGDIPALLEKISDGYDLVIGWRKRRRDAYLSKTLPSVTINRILNIITGIQLHDIGCTLKAYKRQVIKDIKLYGGMHRFIPLLAMQKRFRITEIEVKHFPRIYGKSKNGFQRVKQVVLDLLAFAFSQDLFEMAAVRLEKMTVFFAILSFIMCVILVLSGLFNAIKLNRYFIMPVTNVILFIDISILVFCLSYNYFKKYRAHLPYLIEKIYA